MQVPKSKCVLITIVIWVLWYGDCHAIHVMLHILGTTESYSAKELWFGMALLPSPMFISHYYDTMTWTRFPHYWREPTCHRWNSPQRVCNVGSDNFVVNKMLLNKSPISRWFATQWRWYGFTARLHGRHIYFRNNLYHNHKNDKNYSEWDMLTTHSIKRAVIMLRL